ncbi:MAG: sulfotransferase family protein [Stappiaceae bacterium]
MALSVIGAGFGRTGTDSMKTALTMLGLGPCHHMKEVIPNPEQVKMWRSIAQGNVPDWHAVFAGYNSAVDWPSAFYWRELADFYPDAKILLTVRDVDSWHKSMENTIFKGLRASTDEESLGLKLIANGVFGGRMEDREHAIAVYEKNIADVQSAFGPDRLLTYTIGDGWEPLCRFLGKQIPDEPYPHSNSTKDFTKILSDPK